MSGAEGEARLAASVRWDADFVLDEDFRFISAALLPPLSVDAPTGRRVWDLLGGEKLFRSRWQSVFDDGESLEERVFFDGALFEVSVEPWSRFLRVRYRLLGRAEVKTLDDLLSSVRNIRDMLAAPFGSPAIRP